MTGEVFFCTPIIRLMHSQTCIKRSPLGSRKKMVHKTCDLLKEVQFIWNILWEDKKKVTF